MADILVTGANSGIGKALVEALAERGHRLVLACRSEAKARPVIDQLRSRYPASDPLLLPLDLADLASVRTAAASFLSSGRGLDVLVNNAGIAGTRALSEDGFDLTYATNHIGPFLFTNLVLPRLMESPEGRIVTVASAAHFTAKQMNWSGLERRATPKRSGFADYAVTKLMNVLHVRELARRLAGTRITTYAVHPGAVASNVWRAVPQPLRWIATRFMLSNEEGAQTPLYCATSPELRGISGRYYDKCRETKTSLLAADDGLARELWERTERLVG
jgi:dehydrogenase/reductase SDR family protein 13